VWGSAWIDIHYNSILLKARSHMTSHYTWETMTTLHDFGGVLGRPLNTFFWAPTISRSRLLALSGRSSMFIVAHRNCGSFQAIWRRLCGNIYLYIWNPKASTEHFMVDDWLGNKHTYMYNTRRINLRQKERPKTNHKPSAWADTTISSFSQPHD
jgi:hypothetical protein